VRVQIVQTYQEEGWKPQIFRTLLTFEDLTLISCIMSVINGFLCVHLPLNICAVSVGSSFGHTQQPVPEAFCVTFAARVVTPIPFSRIRRRIMPRLVGRKSYPVGVGKDRYMFCTGQKEVPRDHTEDREYIICIGA
jgi:hypothetical protein